MRIRIETSDRVCRPSRRCWAIVLTSNMAFCGEAVGQQVVLRLPFADGTSHLCTQGANGSYSHQFNSTRYDVDLDTSNSSDETLYAPAAGTAYTLDEGASGFGKHINIALGDGTFVILGHLKSFLVANGTAVVQGQPVGIEGCTGACSGDHVHFGLHVGNAQVGASSSTSIVAERIWTRDVTTGGSFQEMASTDFIGDLVSGHRYEAGAPPSSPPGATQTSWLWSVDGNRSSWMPYNYSADVVSGGIWTINPNHDMYIVSPLLTRAPSSVNYLRVGIKNKGQNEEGQLFYYAPGLPPNEGRSRWFATPSILQGDRFNWITVRLDDISGWSTASNIDRIRIDPVRTDVPLNGNDDILIDYVFLRKDASNPNQPTITSWSPTGWTNGNFSVSFNSNDPPPAGYPNPVGPDVYGSGINDFRYRVGNGSDSVKLPDSFDDRSGVASASVTVSAVQQGANTFHVYCFDRVGRVSVENTATLYFDSTAPGTPSVISVVPSGWTSSNGFTFSWTNPGDGHSGINRYQWRIDGGAANDHSATSLAIPAPSPGQHSFQVRAVDNAGNAGNWSSPATNFFYDPVAPGTPSVTSVTPSGWSNSNSFAVSWTNPGDAHSGINRFQWRLNGGSPVDAPGNGVSGVQVPGQGQHAFEARAIDNAGNTGGWSSPAQISFDDVPPGSPGAPDVTPAGYTAINDFLISWAAGTDAHSGLDGYEYRVNGTQIASVTQPPLAGALATTEGPNLFEVRARDQAGNVSDWASALFYYDSTVPAAPTLDADPAVCSAVNSFTVSWPEVSDPQGIVRYEYRLGGEGAPIDSTTGLQVIIATSTECGQSFEVRAVDGVENTGPWSQVNLCWDGTPPNVPALQVTPAGWTQSNSFQVAWQAVADACTGGVTYCTHIGAAAIPICGSNTELSGSLARFEGVDTLYVQSRDAVGNESSAAAGLLHYDATPPAAAIGAMPSLTMDLSFVVRWSGSDNASGVTTYDVQYSDSLIGYWQALATATAADSIVIPTATLEPEYRHTYMFRVRARDVAGNLGSYSSAEVKTTYVPRVSGALEDVVFARPVIQQVVPNPFNPSVLIRYSVPSHGRVQIRVFDTAGRLVKALLDGITPAGAHEVEWDGVDEQGRHRPGGVYLARLDSHGSSSTVKLVMVR